MGGTGEAEARRLFEALRDEIWGRRHWDSDFTPSPHQPDVKLRELVDGVGAAAVPLLLDALRGDSDLRFWACVGLTQIGPAAGDTAIDVLVEHVGARRDPLWAAAVALEAIAPERARALGVHRLPETMEHITDRYLRLPGDAVDAHAERFVREEADEDVVRFLGQHRLRDRMCHDCPPRLADLLRGLLHSGRGDAVRRAAAEILALAAVDAVTEDLIEALRHGGPLSTGVVDRVAAHPASERLIPRLIGKPGASDALAALIMRRRCAGLATDPAPLREFLRLCVEQPGGRWPGPRHSASAAAAIAGLRDGSMLAHLLPMLHEQRLGTLEWNAVIGAFASFGATGRALLDQHRREHPEVERIQWAIDAVQVYSTPLRRLDAADDAFLRGRIETSLGGAFTVYADVLLTEPSAHAAFQLAWIDRAYGAPVTTARADWIRRLGFADEGLLADVARPVGRPLDGLRFGWDCGGTRRHDPVRAARAAAAGLPSLAAGWCRDDALDRAARDHLDRVRRAAPPAVPIAGTARDQQ